VGYLSFVLFRYYLSFYYYSYTHLPTATTYLPTFQPSNLPTFQPSNLPTFQPSLLSPTRYTSRLRPQGHMSFLRLPPSFSSKFGFVLFQIRFLLFQIGSSSSRLAPPLPDWLLLFQIGSCFPPPLFKPPFHPSSPSSLRRLPSFSPQHNFQLHLYTRLSSLS